MHTLSDLNVNRQILKSACMRAIFNNDGSISDVRRSVLVMVKIPTDYGMPGGVKRSVTLFSSAEFDALPDLVETAAHLPIGSVIEVWDGRLLSTRRKNAEEGYYKLTTIPQGFSSRICEANPLETLEVGSLPTVPTQSEVLF